MASVNAGSVDELQRLVDAKTPTMTPNSAWILHSLEMATPINQTKSTLEDCCKLLRDLYYKELSV